MPTVMLVDDEQPVLDGISSVIERLLPQLTIVGRARNGHEAIDKAMALKPDIILIDVKMPGLNGIDVLNELKRLRIDALPILLTAYERFDVAQSAFELGVFEYLVKPMNQERLVEVLSSAVLRIEERSQGRRETISYREKIEGLKPFLEEAFFSDLFAGGGKRALVCSIELGIAAEKGILAAFSTVKSLPLDEQETLSDAIRSTLTFRHRCIVGAASMAAFPVFIPLDDTKDDLPRFFHGLRRLVFELEGLGLGVAARDEVLRYEEIAGAWPSLAAAARRARSGELLLESATAQAAEDRESDERAYEAIVGRDPQAVEPPLMSRFSLILTAAGMEAARRWAVGAIASAIAAADRRLPSQAEAVVEALFSATDADALMEAFRAGIVEVARRKRLVSERPRSRQVAEAVAYLHGNFAEAVSLEALAERVDARPSYLSKLFQDETGKSFIEYLIALRIDHAKHELLGGGKSIKEIAVSSGYSDANYFSRLFKKETGSTPSEFIQQGGSQP